MGKICLPLTCFLIIQLFPGSIQKISSQKITVKQWKDDLHHFKQLVHHKYNNLFYNVTASQFDSAVATLDKKIVSLDDVKIKVEFAKLVSMFRIGHTMLRQRTGSENSLTPWVQQVPVRFYYFHDGIFVRRIDNRYKEALGGRLTAINETGIKEVLEKLRTVVPYENEQGFASMLPWYLNIPEFLYGLGIISSLDTVTYHYEKDDKQNSITMPAEKLPGAPAHGGNGLADNWSDAYPSYNKSNSVLWIRNPGRIRDFEYLPTNRTVYIRHSAVQDEHNETIAAFFEKAFHFIDSAEVDRLILDLRLNGGGNNYLNKPVITGIIQSKKINKKGHFFVITGKETFSAAQNLVNELEKYTEVIFVGEPTSENVNFYGDTRTEILPNSKLNLNLSWLWWQNMDPRDKRKWTAPKLAADMKFSDYQKGVDPSLNAIMNYRMGEDGEERINSLIREGKYADALTAARKYIDDPVNRHYSGTMETRLNDMGYRLMGQGKLKEANQVLHMNIELFPSSANVYDSYAESLWKLGKNSEAIAYYELAISKDPQGPTGENARKMIAQLK